MSPPFASSRYPSEKKTNKHTPTHKKKTWGLLRGINLARPQLFLEPAGPVLGSLQPGDLSGAASYSSRWDFKRKPGDGGQCSPASEHGSFRGVTKNRGSSGNM